MGISSGNVGYCHKIGSSRGILIGWRDHEVISVDCEHETCGYADRCKLYQQNPVGYIKVFPMSRTSEKP